MEQPNVIFVPEAAPPAKIAQLLVYGSTVMLVKGTYDDAFDLCMQAVAEYGWYNRNTGYNPYMTEGKKTAGLEILEHTEIDARTTVERALHPAFADATPLAVVVVDMEEGVRLLANMQDCPPEELEVGMPVEVVYEAVTDAVTLPRFRRLS